MRIEFVICFFLIGLNVYLISEWKPKKEDIKADSIVKCIKGLDFEFDLKSGIATFWNANYTTAKLKNVRILPFFQNLKRFKWLVNEKWYTEYYDFIIFENQPNPIDEIFQFSYGVDDFIDLYGTPDSIINCNLDYTILIYMKNNIEVNDQNFKWLPIESITYSQVGSFENKKLVSTDQTGTLLYGPYIDLSEGDYHCKVYGKISSENVIKADIVSNAAKNKIGDYLLDNLFDGVLLDTLFHVDSDFGKNLEVRIFVDTNDMVELDSLIIEKQ